MNATTSMEPIGRLIRLKELLTIVPLGRSTIYARIAKGEFPAALDLGGGVVAWYEADVRSWIADRLPVNAPAVAGSNDDVGVSAGVSARKRC